MVTASLASGMPLAGGRGDSGMAIAYQSVVGPGGLTLVAAAAAQASAILLVSNLNEEVRFLTDIDNILPYSLCSYCADH
jgi:hypothetical protein